MGPHHHHHAQHQEQHYGYGVPPPAADYYPPAYPPPYGYSANAYAIQPFQPYAAPSVSYSPHHNNNFSLDEAMADHHRHSRNEHMAEAGALAAGTFAMYEAHKAKVDPLHAQRHKMEAGAAGVAALGSAAYALHERHEKKKDEHLISSFNGNLENHHNHSHQHQHHRKHHHF